MTRWMSGIVERIKKRSMIAKKANFISIILFPTRYLHVQENSWRIWM